MKKITFLWLMALSSITPVLAADGFDAFDEGKNIIKASSTYITSGGMDRVASSTAQELLEEKGDDSVVGRGIKAQVQKILKLKREPSYERTQEDLELGGEATSARSAILKASNEKTMIAEIVKRMDVMADPYRLTTLRELGEYLAILKIVGETQMTSVLQQSDPTISSLKYPHLGGSFLKAKGALQTKKQDTTFFNDVYPKSKTLFYTCAAKDGSEYTEGKGIAGRYFFFAIAYGGSLHSWAENVVRFTNGSFSEAHPKQLQALITVFDWLHQDRGLAVMDSLLSRKYSKAFWYPHLGGSYAEAMKIMREHLKKITQVDQTEKE